MKTESNGKQMLEEALQSGVSPIIFSYQDVVFFQKETHLARTFMVFNSVELGTLTMKEYRFVARRTPQGVQMVRRHVVRMVRMIPKFLEKFPSIEYFTIPVFPRTVLDGSLVRILYDTFALYPGAHPAQICIEVPADILFEDMNVVKSRLTELSEFGVKVAISEVGAEYCPLFKLTGLPFDLLLLDQYTTDILESGDADRVLAGLVQYLHSFGVPVIAPELDTQTKIDNAKLIECDGYSAAHVANSFGAPRREDDADERDAGETVAEAEDLEIIIESDEPEVTEAPAEIDEPEVVEEITEPAEAEIPAEEPTVDAPADETSEAESEQEKEYEE